MSEEEPLQVLLLAGRMQARGSSAYTCRLARHLTEFDVVPRLACCQGTCLSDDLRRKITVDELPLLDFPLLGRFVARDLIKRLRPQLPQLIHAQTPESLRTGELLAASLKVPLVLTVHDFLPPHCTFRFHPPHGGKIIVVSDPVREDLLERTALDSRVVQVVHSGVETADSLDEEPDDGSQSDQRPACDRVPVIGTAGPLEHLKGHVYFLEAARTVLDSGRDVEFLIVGSGPEEVPLRRRAEELKIASRVTFVPFVKEYSEILKAVDIFCLPSLQQGLGTVMLEAMALGKPVITTDVGGTAEVVTNGQTGLVVPSRDPQTLADRMIDLLNDPDRAQQLGHAGYERARQSFSIEQMMNATVRVYRDVLGLPVPLTVRHAESE